MNKVSRDGQKPNRSFLWIASAVVLLAFLCSRYLFQLMLIQGDSMVPAYHNLELTVLDKRKTAYQPGDVIAFRCEELHAVLVKRVAAVPGDSVQVVNGTLLVNGGISEVYPEEGCFSYSGILAEPVTLADGEYIVIGDNLEESKDSRYDTIGPVKEQLIIGKVLGSK